VRVPEPDELNEAVADVEGILTRFLATENIAELVAATVTTFSVASSTESKNTRRFKEISNVASDIV